MPQVNGPLNRAQAENVNGLPGGPQPTGRFVCDVSTPSDSKFYMWNGSAWKEVPWVEPSAPVVVIGSSGKATTIDWSNGLTQILTLTDNCVISFSNPQADQVHTLIVKNPDMASGNTSLAYCFNFDMADQDTAYERYQPSQKLAQSMNRRFQWYYRAGIKAQYLNVSANTFAPDAIPATLATGISISPDGKNIAMGRTTTPFVTQYTVRKPSEASLNYLGIFVRSPLTVTAITAQARGIVWHPDGKTVFSAVNSSPYIQASTAINPATGDGYALGGNYANPGILPAGPAQCVDVHPSGFAVGVGHTTSPFISVYPWLSAGFGTKIANPSTLPAAQVNAMAFSPQGDFIATGCQTTPFIEAWAFNAVNGGANALFGAKVADPAILPAGGPVGSLGKGIAWRPQGDWIAMAMSTTPFYYLIPFSRSTGTFGTPLTLSALPGAANCVQWTPDGQYLLIGTGTSPFFHVFDFSTGTPVAVTFDGSGPVGAVNDIDVDPTGTYAALALNVSPFTQIFTLPMKIRNYLRTEG